MTTPLPLKDLPREEQDKQFRAFMEGRLMLHGGMHVGQNNHKLDTDNTYVIRPRRVSVDAELLDRLKEPAALLVGCNHTSNAVHVGLFANGVMELAASAEELP